MSDSCDIVQYPVGETCVPQNPQRLATLVLPALSNAIALGVQPVGSIHHPVGITQSEDGNMFPEYLPNDTQEDIEPLGRLGAPNLETISLLKPDLILGWQVANSEVYPSLSQIAPTILYDWQGTKTWREYFNFMAEVLNREDAAERAWSDYYDRVEQLKTALGDRYANKTISFVYFCCDGFGSQAPESFMGSILEDIGLQRPSSQAMPAPPYGEIQFSEERLPEADGDVIFLASYYDSDRAYLNSILEKPLWKQLKAVQQNHVHIVDAETWRGGNLLAAHAIIDDLSKYLLDTPSSES
ncbi:MAG: iron-siderophore ABC transporter substrate-binding protein [Cyanobacteria bacterium J06649_4]